MTTTSNRNVKKTTTKRKSVKAGAPRIGRKIGAKKNAKK